ncbi:hypothetical protein [Erythrobacter sp. JK5]|uniref:hypothetical protein n=1 Tax=Erythrobacter sp. JK5 TaxID=2829500 RepID=UPI001BA9C9BD|nr:hypothetical protein [Erythrobacter sp. JK5]QUL37718.1 hypothetical protein KDC96_15475 [Erythrobacter sp. JK5]
MTTIDAARFRWREHGGGDAVAARCLDFLTGIGIECAPIGDEQAQLLDGLAIVGGRLLIDPAIAVWPGDLLHEAGHIAIAAPEERSSLGPIGPDGGDEMAAIAWSYAAACACDVSLEQLFHDGGYRGESETLRTAFADQGYIGAPMLGYFGMTDPHGIAGKHPYPSMIRWLR